MEETEALVSIDVNTGSHKGDRKDGRILSCKRTLRPQWKFAGKCA